MAVSQVQSCTQYWYQRIVWLRQSAVLEKFQAGYVVAMAKLASVSEVRSLMLEAEQAMYIMDKENSSPHQLNRENDTARAAKAALQNAKFDLADLQHNIDAVGKEVELTGFGVSSCAG